MFDLYDERNFIVFVFGYGVFGGYVGRVVDVLDMGVKVDLLWIEEKCNDVWGIELWYFDQCNIFMKILYIMCCDIEFFKVILIVIICCIEEYMGREIFLLW